MGDDIFREGDIALTALSPPATTEPPPETKVSGLEAETESEAAFENVVEATAQAIERNASVASTGTEEEHDYCDNEENDPTDSGHDIER